MTIWVAGTRRTEPFSIEGDRIITMVGRYGGSTVNEIIDQLANYTIEIEILGKCE